MFNKLLSGQRGLRVSFLSKLKKGISGAYDAVNSDEFEINGIKLRCIHCGHRHFEVGDAQLNTAGLTALNLDWANDSASTVVCKSCSFIMWFAATPNKV